MMTIMTREGRESYLFFMVYMDSFLAFKNVEGNITSKTTVHYELNVYASNYRTTHISL